VDRIDISLRIGLIEAIPSESPHPFGQTGGNGSSVWLYSLRKWAHEAYRVEPGHRREQSGIVIITVSQDVATSRKVVLKLMMLKIDGALHVRVVRIARICGGYGGVMPGGDAFEAL